MADPAAVSGAGAVGGVAGGVVGSTSNPGMQVARTVLLPGDIVDGKYRIERQIGEGGMGVVYLAQDTITESPIVIKAIRSDLAHQPEYRERVRQEARALARIDHPNVVRLNAVISSPETMLLVMQYVDGGSLDRIVAEHRARGAMMPADQVFRLFRQIVAGVAAAHAEGVVHRDIKPANVLVRARDGAAKVTDFGLAKPEEDARAGRGQTRGIIGSLWYMAPEQVTGQRDLDKRVDVYALGILLYELLVGHVPFDAGSDYEVMRMHAEMPIPSVYAQRRDIPPSIDTLLARLCAKRRDDRPSNCDEILVALEGSLAGTPFAANQRYAPPIPTTVPAMPAYPDPSLGTAQTQFVPTQSQSLPHGVPTERSNDAQPPGAGYPGAGYPGAGYPQGAVYPAGPVPGYPQTPAPGYSQSPATARDASVQPQGAAYPAPGYPQPPTSLDTSTGHATTAEGAALTTEEANGSPSKARLLAGLIAAMTVGSLTVLVVWYAFFREPELLGVPGSGSASARSSSSTSPSSHVVASASAKTDPLAQLSSLQGRWISETGRHYDAVLSGSALEFRVRDPKEFESQGYLEGESRFTLRLPAKGTIGEFLVEDRVRPLPPGDLSYAPASRGTCSEIWSTLGTTPLRAEYGGGQLSVDMVKISPDRSVFTVKGTSITGCSRLSASKVDKLESVLKRE